MIDFTYMYYIDMTFFFYIQYNILVNRSELNLYLFITHSFNENIKLFFICYNNDVQLKYIKIQTVKFR